MKKLLTSVLAVSLCATSLLSFSACGKKDDKSEKQETFDVVSQAMIAINDGEYSEAYQLLKEHEENEAAAELLEKFVFVPTKVMCLDKQSNDSYEIRTYTYDKNGFCVKQTQHSEIAEYTYDENGNLTHIDFTLYDDTPGYIDYTYDEHGHLASKVYAVKNDYNDDFSIDTTVYPRCDTVHPETTNPHFVYDENGNLLKDDDATYAYDEQNRLIKKTYTGPFGRIYIDEFIYDNRGNCIRENHTVNDGGDMSSSSIEFAYDDNNNKICKSDNFYEYTISWKPLYYPNGVPATIRDISLLEFDR